MYLLNRAPGHDSIFVTMSTKRRDTGSEQVIKIGGHNAPLLKREGAFWLQCHGVYSGSHLSFVESCTCAVPIGQGSFVITNKLNIIYIHRTKIMKRKCTFLTINVEPRNWSANNGHFLCGSCLTVFLSANMKTLKLKLQYATFAISKASY